MYYDLAESVRSIDCAIHPELYFFVSYCFENVSIAHNLRTTGLIQVGFSENFSSPNEHLSEIEN